MENNELFNKKIMIDFKEKCGFTFVFETNIITIKNKISTAEIKPIGIIYKQNNEIYLAKFDKIKNIDEIVKKYVCENKTTLEEEYFHFQQ